MTPLTEAELANLEALERAASEPPWKWLDSDGDPYDGDELQDGKGEMVANNFRDDVLSTLTDGRLCAAARNHLRSLLVEVRASRERERVLMEALENCASGHHNGWHEGRVPFNPAMVGFKGCPVQSCKRAAAALATPPTERMTWTEALANPDFKQAVDEGLADMAAGRVQPWSEVERSLATPGPLRSSTHDLSNLPCCVHEGTLSPHCWACDSTTPPTEPDR